ncbi:MAG TPA: hypothetical protein VER03_15475 [Bryobacteraceae bacterium]|nr:hypothetical protein [Bryobacteraceae bacterium]
MILALLLAVTPVVLWQEPGPVEAFDFSSVANPPRPPYTFLREDMGGTGPKVFVRDAAGIQWRVKGGRDVMSETFITRFVTALGYYAETTVFSAHGRIEGIPALKRASGFIQPDGAYTWASFERIEPGAKFVGSWSWIDPGLRHTRELKGLKALVMLFSNWDNKDSRDSYKGSNTSILRLADGRRVYFVNDWGQSFGAWGRLFGRMNWDCRLYTQQTSEFVNGERDGYVQFGFTGAHTLLFRHDIRVEDVRWLMQYLGKITDAQIRVGFKAAGANLEEEDCFTRALRARIEQLRKITLQ